MGLIRLLVTIGLVGLVAWAITQFLPMPENFKKLIWVVAIVACVLYVLGLYGLSPLRGPG